jgi:hypothetical protein
MLMAPHPPHPPHPLVAPMLMTMVKLLLDHNLLLVHHR